MSRQEAENVRDHSRSIDDVDKRRGRTKGLASRREFDVCIEPDAMRLLRWGKGPCLANVQVRLRQPRVDPVVVCEHDLVDRGREGGKTFNSERAHRREAKDVRELEDGLPAFLRRDRWILRNPTII
jgi:hypothetical protein